MTARTAPATPNWVSYSNAYSTVIRTAEAAMLPERSVNASLGFVGIVGHALRHLRAGLAHARAAAQHRAAIKHASDDALAVTRMARSLERDYPSLAAELHAAVARHASRDDEQA